MTTAQLRQLAARYPSREAFRDALKARFGEAPSIHAVNRWLRARNPVEPVTWNHRLEVFEGEIKSPPPPQPTATGGDVLDYVPHT